MVLAVALAMIEPGQIPEWRPGAAYWKPLADGREVTVYSTLHGGGKLCVGPMADPTGFDDGFVYPELQSAIKAAHDWDSENEILPPGPWTKRESGPKAGLTTEAKNTAVINSAGVKPGSLVALTEELEQTCEVTEMRSMGERTVRMMIEGPTEDGKRIHIEGVRESDSAMGKMIRVDAVHITNR